jgi:hypothetical protein
MQNTDLPPECTLVMLELSSSMRATARAPSSPKSSPANPRRHCRASLRHTATHAHATPGPPSFNHAATNTTTLLCPLTEVSPCNHTRIPLESAAYRLAARGTNFNFCKIESVSNLQHSMPAHNPFPANNCSTRAATGSKLTNLQFLEGGVVALQRSDRVPHDLLLSRVHFGRFDGRVCQWGREKEERGAEEGVHAGSESQGCV